MEGGVHGLAGRSAEVFSVIGWRRGRGGERAETSGVSPPLPLPPPLSLTSALPLPLLPRASLAGHGVAAVWVPLHVADAPHRLELGAAGAVLVEVPVVALLQQELAATVTRELVPHPAAGRGAVVKEGKYLSAAAAFTQYSRSTADNHAAHSVCEAVGEQAGDVVVHDLHLAALELTHLVQADLVLLGVLKERTNLLLRENSEAK